MSKLSFRSTWTEKSKNWRRKPFLKCRNNISTMFDDYLHLHFVVVVIIEEQNRSKAREREREINRCAKANEHVIIRVRNEQRMRQNNVIPWRLVIQLLQSIDHCAMWWLCPMCTNVRAHVIHSKDQLGFFSLSLLVALLEHAIAYVQTHSDGCVWTMLMMMRCRAERSITCRVRTEGGMLSNTVVHVWRKGEGKRERESSKTNEKGEKKRGKRKHLMPTSKDQRRESEVTLVLFLVA